MSTDIGKWARRRETDRIVQSGKWHRIQSEIEDRVVTMCGREMHRHPKWWTPYAGTPMGSRIEQSMDISESPDPAQICQRCQ